MDRHKQDGVNLDRRTFIRRAAVASGALFLGQALRGPWRAAADGTPIPFWTIAQANLPQAPGPGVLAFLPTGLSQSRNALTTVFRNVGAVSYQGDSGSPEQTSLWVLGGSVESMSRSSETAIDVVTRESVGYHFVGLETFSFYPYAIWDDSVKIVTMYLPDGTPYEQAVPATWEVDFPVLTTVFNIVDAETLTSLGTIAYELPSGLISSTFTLPPGLQ
jgi:hypothetical protein